MRCEYLLVTDLDGTLLGDDASLQAFRQHREAIPTRMQLVYASGRLVVDVRALIAERELCAPDAIIGGVGTQIEFSEGMVVDWCRPTTASWDASRIRSLLHDLPLQPDRFQTDHKVSFYLRDASDGILTALQRLLSSAGIEADLIYSSLRDLDVLPRGINKGTAAKFLAEHWGIKSSRVIVCGDSGNDLSLFQNPFRGVVVANCLPELRQLSGGNIYFATEKYAAGVLQGIDHWLTQETAAGERACNGK